MAESCLAAEVHQTGHKLLSVGESRVTGRAAGKTRGTELATQQEADSAQMATYSVAQYTH